MKLQNLATQTETLLEEEGGEVLLQEKHENKYSNILCNSNDLNHLLRQTEKKSIFYPIFVLRTSKTQNPN